MCGVLHLCPICKTLSDTQHKSVHFHENYRIRNRLVIKKSYCSVATLIPTHSFKAEGCFYYVY